MTYYQHIEAPADQRPTREERRLEVQTVDDIHAMWNDRQALESLAAQVNEDIRWIQTQLGDRNRLGPDGKRLTNDQYWDWRHRATGAINHKTTLYRALKARLKELSPTSENKVVELLQEIVQRLERIEQRQEGAA